MITFKEFCEAVFERAFDECTAINAKIITTYFTTDDLVQKNIPLNLEGVSAGIDVEYISRQFRISHDGWTMVRVFTPC